MLSDTGKQLKYNNSFVIPISLHDIGIEQAIYTNDPYNSNGNTNYFKSYGNAFYYNSLDPTTHTRYTYTFKIPTVNTKNIKFLRIVNVYWNENPHDTNDVSKPGAVPAYFGPLLIRSNMINSSDNIMATIVLGGASTDYIGPVPIVNSASPNQLFKTSQPFSGSFQFEFLGLSANLDSTSVSAGIINNTFISLSIELLEEAEE